MTHAAGSFVEMALLRSIDHGASDDETVVGLFSPAFPEKTARVRLHYLRSYDTSMGAVDVMCRGGCTCPPLTIDAHWEERRSTTELIDWKVHATAEAGGDAECLVRLEVKDSARHPEKTGYKFKLISVNVDW